jgi:hypothetical protein
LQWFINRKGIPLMPEFKFTCTYCDHHFDRMVYSQPKPGDIRCPKCSDPNLTVDKDKTDGDTDPYGYRYSPPFPEKVLPGYSNSSYAQDYYEPDSGH